MQVFTVISFIIIFMIMKPKHISIALTPDILKKLENSKYNKSKLIDSLLSDYFKNKNR